MDKEVEDGRRLFLLIKVSGVVAIQVLIGETTLMKEKGLPTHDDRGVRGMGSWVNYRGSVLGKRLNYSEEEDSSGRGKRMVASLKEVGVAKRFTLFGLGNQVNRAVEVVDRKIIVLLDRGTPISMVRLKEFMEVGFISKELETSDLRRIQADGREIKISSIIRLPVMVAEMVSR